MKKKRFLAIFLVLTMLVSLMPMGFAEEAEELVEEPAEVPAEEIVDETPAEEPAEPETPAVPEEELVVEEDDSEEALRAQSWWVKFYKVDTTDAEGPFDSYTQTNGSTSYTAPTKNNPTLDGYVFGGWSSVPNDTDSEHLVFKADKSPAVTPLPPITANTNFYGVWTPIKVTVAFNKIDTDALEAHFTPAEIATVTWPDNDEADFGSAYELPTEPSFEGFTLNWYIVGAGQPVKATVTDNTYTINNYNLLTGDTTKTLTLKGVYEAPPAALITLTFDPGTSNLAGFNDSKIIEPDIYYADSDPTTTGIQIPSGTKVIINNIGKVGYKGTGFQFDKWTVGGVEYTEQELTADTNFVGSWTDKFVVRFYTTPTATGDPYATSQPVTYNTKLGSLPTPPTASGSTFSKWVDKKDGTTVIDENTVVKENTDAIAIFTSKTYTVTFLNGEEVDGKLVDHVAYVANGQPIGAGMPDQVPTIPGKTATGHWYKTNAAGEFISKTDGSVIDVTKENWQLDADEVLATTTVSDDFYVAADYTDVQYTVTLEPINTTPSPIAEPSKFVDGSAFNPTYKDGDKSYVLYDTVITPLGFADVIDDGTTDKANYEFVAWTFTGKVNPDGTPATKDDQGQWPTTAVEGEIELGANDTVKTAVEDHGATLSNEETTLTLHGKWVRYYTVTFTTAASEAEITDDNKAVVTVDSEKDKTSDKYLAVVPKTDEITALENVAADKFFGGWYTTNTYATNTKFVFDKPVGQHDEDNRTKIEKNTIVFGRVADAVTITFDDNGATKNPAGKTLYYFDTNTETKQYYDSNKFKIEKGVAFASSVSNGMPKADKDGFSFVAWLLPNGTTAMTDETKFTSDATVTAQWVAGRADVKFIYNNETQDSKTINVEIGKVIPETSIPKPEYEGFAIEGWYVVDDKGQTSEIPFDFSTPITKALTLRAEWAEAVCNVVSEGVTTPYASMEAGIKALKTGDTLNLLKNTNVNTNVIVSKSATINLGGKTVTLGKGVKIEATGDAVVTLQGGTIEGGALSGKYIVKSGTFTDVSFANVQNPAGAAYAIQGGQFSKTSVDTIADTLYDSTKYMFGEVAESGYYELVGFKTLTFVAADADTPVNTAVKVPNGTNPSPLDLDPDKEGIQNPVKTGFALYSWNTKEKSSEQTGTTDFDFTTPLKADTTVYARWGAEVTFNYLVKKQSTDDDVLKVSYVLPISTVVNSVQPGGAVSVTTKQAEQVVLDPANLPLVPATANKVFDYWATTDGSPWIAYDFTREVTGNLELFANYKSAVVFVANGGTFEQYVGELTPVTTGETMTFTVGQNGVINPLPTVTSAAGDAFVGWYVADEDGAPTNVRFNTTDKVTSDLNVVAVYNNTVWQVAKVYTEATPKGSTIDADKKTVVFAGTENQPIELVKLTNKTIGSDTLNGYFIGYQFEAPDEITSSNINLYRIKLNGSSNWIPLADVIEEELSASGHFVVNVFEPIDIDAIKTWVPGGVAKVQTYTYQFASTADLDNPKNLTVTFNPSFVQFGGMVPNPEDPSGDPVFEVNEFSVYNSSYVFEVAFDLKGAGANPTLITVTSGQTVAEAVAEKQKTDKNYKNPMATPVYADGTLWEFQYWTVEEINETQQKYHDDKVKEPVVFTDGEPIWKPTTVYAFNHKLANVELMVIKLSDLATSTEFYLADAYGDPVPQVLTLWYGSPRDDVKAALEEKGYVNKNNELEGFYLDGTDQVVGFGGRTFVCWAYLNEGKYTDFTDNATFHKDWTLADGSKGFVDAEDKLVLTAKFDDVDVTFHNLNQKFVGKNNATITGAQTKVVGVGKSLNYWAGIEGNDLPVPVVAKDMTYYWTTVEPDNATAWTWKSVPAEFDMESALEKNTVLYAYPHADNEVTVTFAQPVDASQITVLDTLNIEKGKSLDETDYALPVPEYDKDMEDYYWTSVAPDKWTVGVKPAEYDKKSPIDDDLTLYAYVYEVKAEVTFFTKIDDITGTKVAVEIGKAIPTDAYPEVTIPEGMTFAGWSTVARGTQDYPKMFDTTTKIETAISLWAVFQEAPAFVPTLNLADYTGVRVYIDLPEGADASEYTAEWSYKTYRQEKTDSKKVSELPVGKAGTKYEGMYLVDALRAASTEMSDTVTVKLTKGNEVVKTETFTVKGIADKMIEDGADAPTALVLNALKQYGYYGQKVFHNKEDDLPNIDDAPALVAIPDDYASSDPTTFGAYVTKFEDKLDLNSATKMNLYFTLADGYTANDFTFTVLDKDGQAYTKCNVTGTTKVKVQIEGILSPQLARNFQVVVTLKSDTTKTATWTRSAIACAYTYQQGSNNDVNVPKLMQSLYQYYLASAALFPQYK